MPTYEYENIDTGERVEMILPSSQRDNVPGHRRLIVPCSVAIVGLRSNPYSQEAQVLAGFRRLEERGTLGKLDYTPDQIKRAWAEPAPADTNPSEN